MENKVISTSEELAQSIADATVKKASMSTPRFFVLFMLGGAFIALGGLFSITVAGGVPSLASEMPGLVRLLAGITFPIGLVMVIIAGGGLFTSDCASLPFTYWKNRITNMQILRMAVVGYIANFIGALFIAWLLGYQSGTISKEPWVGYVSQIAVQKTSSSFLIVFIKGIGANLLVCLAVWMATAAKDVGGKVVVIWLPIMTFVTLGWEHSIANMFFIPMGMFVGAPVTIDAFLLDNLLPTTLGNITAGILFVALPYYFIWGSAKDVTEDNVMHPDTLQEQQHATQEENTRNQKFIQAIKQQQHGSNN
jgi:formate transporter